MVTAHPMIFSFKTDLNTVISFELELEFEFGSQEQKSEEIRLGQSVLERYNFSVIVERPPQLSILFNAVF
jgi:hypothetical protein